MLEIHPEDAIKDENKPKSIYDITICHEARKAIVERNKQRYARNNVNQHKSDMLDMRRWVVARTLNEEVYWKTGNYILQPSKRQLEQLKFDFKYR